MLIMTGSLPKTLTGGSKMDSDDVCDAHHEAFAPRVHPEGNRKGGEHLHDHKRGAGPPAMHTKGKLPSQLNIDHGPHRGAGRHK